MDAYDDDKLPDIKSLNALKSQNFDPKNECELFLDFIFEFDCIFYA